MPPFLTDRALVWGCLDASFWQIQLLLLMFTKCTQNTAMSFITQGRHGSKL
jgi:hypothetical protein